MLSDGLSKLIRLRSEVYGWVLLRSEMRRSFTLHHHALVPCLTGQFSVDPLRYRKICAVPSALFAHILRPHNGPANA
jgi:hypothetical protein